MACLFRLFEPKRRNVEITTDDATLTLVAWQRDEGKFAPVRLTRSEARQFRDALSRWLGGR